MTWRRKPDGRPYADIMRHGVRYRESLLTPERAHDGPPWPDDAQCAELYRLWKTHRLPALLQGSPQGAPHRDSAPQPLPEPGNPRLTDLCNWYVDTVMVGRGNTTHTRERNRTRFTAWAAWFTERGVTHFADMDARPEILDEWLAHLLTHYATTTAYMYTCVLRAVFRAALQRRMIPRIPTEDWPIPRKRNEPRYPEPLTPHETQAVLEQMRTHGLPPFPCSRIYDITRFIVFVGCRPIDAVRLRWSDITGLDTAFPEALIQQAKTGQLVNIALSPPAVQAIRDARTRGYHGPYVFPMPDGSPRTPESVVQGITKHARAVGLDITSRRFRQSVVSTLFDQGVDQALVARITGHRSRAIETYRRIRRGAAHDAAARFARTIENDENT